MSRRPSNPEEIENIFYRALADQSGIGNMLGLPSSIDFNHDSYQGLAARSELENEEARDSSTSSFTAFPESCEIISWAACDGSQLAREDANVGGRFTSAFTKGMSEREEGMAQLTYRALNRRIQVEFDSHNRKVKGANDLAASASGQNSAIRASKTQNAVQKDDYYQYPKVNTLSISCPLYEVLTRMLKTKLYVSNNIASVIADREVVV
ncbi:unnamed protein product [Rhizoctonia solani]|uniref:Uncharacterized protein n=1 Tax=Rhizoctonia solani TaxID=456999 RepID=A0A8H3CCG6_9AGAM|nr:unnamed protein product [Rhizoctonia solani]